MKLFAGLTHDEIVAQGLLFFLAGFETTANTLALLGYNLARHPECQEKLYQEIMEVTGGQVSSGKIEWVSVINILIIIISGCLFRCFQAVQYVDR